MNLKAGLIRSADPVQKLAIIYIVASRNIGNSTYSNAPGHLVLKVKIQSIRMGKTVLPIVPSTIS